MANGAAIGRDPKQARPSSGVFDGILTIKEDIEQQQAIPSDSGQARLEQLGYRQELDRKFGRFSSFAASFSLCSFMLGITGRSPCQSSQGLDKRAS